MSINAQSKERLKISLKKSVSQVYTSRAVLRDSTSVGTRYVANYSLHRIPMKSSFFFN